MCTYWETPRFSRSRIISSALRTWAGHWGGQDDLWPSVMNHEGDRNRIVTGVPLMSRSVHLEADEGRG
jgi:hypothetical protein